MQTVQKNVIAADDFEEMQDLSRFLEQVTEPAALLGPDGQTIPLPMEAFRVLCDVVEFMKQGKAVTIAPIDQRLTTQQAADFLRTKGRQQRLPRLLFRNSDTAIWARGCAAPVVWDRFSGIPECRPAALC